MAFRAYELDEDRTYEDQARKTFGTALEAMWGESGLVPNEMPKFCAWDCEYEKYEKVLYVAEIKCRTFPSTDPMLWKGRNAGLLVEDERLDKLAEWPNWDVVYWVNQYTDGVQLFLPLSHLMPYGMYPRAPGYMMKDDHGRKVADKSGRLVPADKWFRWEGYS